MQPCMARGGHYLELSFHREYFAQLACKTVHTVEILWTHANEFAELLSHLPDGQTTSLECTLARAEAVNYTIHVATT